MLQAQVLAWGDAPECHTVDPPPPPSENEVRVRVLAVGIHQVVRSRAAGQHYSTQNTKPPHVPGIDGVGRLDNGRLVYWTNWTRGSLAEIINLPSHAVRFLPDDIDPVQIAGLINPAMSSWMALSTRTCNLPAQFTILILGATSTSGRVAIHVARMFGARRVVGAARDADALDSLVSSHDLDARIILHSTDPAQTDWSQSGPMDLILDYIYGPTTAHLLSSISTTAEKAVQYVQIGSLGGTEMSLPSAVLRSKNLTMRGAGPGSWSMQDLGLQADDLLAATIKLPKQKMRVEALEDIERAWKEKSGERLVIRCSTRTVI